MLFFWDVISGWICKPNVKMIMKHFTSRYVPILKSTSLLCLFLFRGRVPPRERVTSCNRWRKVDLSTFGVSNIGEAGAAVEVVIRLDHLKRNQCGVFFWGGGCVRLCVGLACYSLFCWVWWWGGKWFPKGADLLNLGWKMRGLCRLQSVVFGQQKRAKPDLISRENYVFFFSLFFSKGGRSLWDAKNSILLR